MIEQPVLELKPNDVINEVFIEVDELVPVSLMGKMKRTCRSAYDMVTDFLYLLVL
ncbi:MAG: hypothetical protein K2X66_17945 [Cyanobacteria bacterium]|nr:hypothetical protein [Cyanobacteriota bacterium]